MRGGILRMSLWSGATLIVAGIVHLASILLLPDVAPNDAYARLSKVTALDILTILPQPQPGEDVVPFRDPAVASAICRYDLRQGGLRVGAAVTDAAFLALSFHGPRGVAYYALTDRSRHEGRIDLLLLTQTQRDKMEAAAADDEPAPEIRVTAPDARGFVQFDALPRIGGYEAARRLLASAGCKLERDL